MTAEKSNRVFSYGTARAATVLMTACAFCAILLVLGTGLVAALTHDVLGLEHARAIAALGLLFVTFFAGHAGELGLLDGYSQGKVQLPTALPVTASPATGGAYSPWRAGLASAACVGMPSSALAFALLPRLWPNGVARERFVWHFATAGAVLAGLIVLRWTGRHFLHEARLPAAQRGFVGSPTSYLWWRHALPQGLVNLAINAWIGIALAPGRTSDPSALVPRTLVQTDLVGTALVLVLVIAAGVRTQARFDVRWGVIAPSLEAPPRIGWRIAAAIALPVLVIACVWLLYAGLRLDGIGVWTFVAWRSIGCGLYCGLIAYYCARWTLAEQASLAAART